METDSLYSYGQETEEENLTDIVKLEVGFEGEEWNVIPSVLDSSHFETVQLKEEPLDYFEDLRESSLPTPKKHPRAPKKPPLKKSQSPKQSGSTLKPKRRPAKKQGSAKRVKGTLKRKRCTEVNSDDNRDQEVVEEQAKKQGSAKQVKGTLKRKRGTEVNSDDNSDKEEVEEQKKPSSDHGVYRSAVHGYVKADYTDDYTIGQILSTRTSHAEVVPGHPEEVNEYYVKFKYKSYLHCKWITEQILNKDDRSHLKLRNFYGRVQDDLLDDGALFHPDYVIVDRVLDERYVTSKKKRVYEYLVKWCSLPYADSTWEVTEDVDKEKVFEFKRIHKQPLILKKLPRPPEMFWDKLEGPWKGRDGLTLRDFQLEGVNWLLFNWYHRQNCILADEMGLGKTIQTIALLTEMHSAGVQGPFLVIVPLSTLGNWAREFSTWTHLYTVVYHGSKANRQVIEEYELFLRNYGKILPGMCKFDVLLTTYEMVLALSPALKIIKFRCVIVDEAHRLKNKNSKLASCLSMLSMEYKVLLTGTPLQNSLEELFSLLSFLEPTQFDSESNFIQKFGNIETKKQVHKLQLLLKPLMLRRLKKDVEKSLKPKEETIIEVGLTDVQKLYYRAILERNWVFLKQDKSGKLMNIMMELRKCCNHPFLLQDAEDLIVTKLTNVLDAQSPDFPLQCLIQSAGKLVLLDQLLPRLKQDGHKVLIFSQMVRMLDILEDYVTQKGYIFERIDGKISGGLRQEAIDRFNKADSQHFLFLICTRAGGQGINLTAADTCIIYDSDWNPQNDLQSQARCHRIGQTKAVMSYRLVTKNTYEQLLLDKAGLKLGLDQAVIQSMSGYQAQRASGIQQFTQAEVETMLKKGAYAAVMEENGGEQRFGEEDIDRILQGRTTSRTIDSRGQEVSSLSKASFVTSQGHSNIEIDDPEFWEKWAKNTQVDVGTLTYNETASLVINQPRRRTQVNRFGGCPDIFVDSEFCPDVPHPSPCPLEVGDLPNRPKTTLGLNPLDGLEYSDYIQVEKMLLRFGWGRWTEILRQLWHVGLCNMPLTDVEDVCRAILSVCLLTYHGKAIIKDALWTLITPFRNQEVYFKHSGLTCEPCRFDEEFNTDNIPWLANYNPEPYLNKLFCNKLKGNRSKTMVHRVRLLLVLKQDVIGDQAPAVMAGASAKEVSIRVPCGITSAGEACPLPGWWDEEADKSLLIGAFKHGYEEFMLMRADPSLCFLEKMGPSTRAVQSAPLILVDEMPNASNITRKTITPVRKRILPEWMLAGSEEFIKKTVTDDAVLKIVEEMECDRDWPTFSALCQRLHQLILGCHSMYYQDYTDH